MLPESVFEFFPQKQPKTCTELRKTYVRDQKWAFMCMSGRKSWFREQKRAKTFMGGGKTSVCEQKQPFMFTGDEKISIREQKWPKTCTDLQKDLYRLLFFRQAQQTVTEVVLKGGAPKAFGAYIRRCFAAPLFFASAQKGRQTSKPTVNFTSYSDKGNLALHVMIKQESNCTRS